MHKISVKLICLLFSVHIHVPLSYSQVSPLASAQNEFWEAGVGNSIRWNVSREKSLPHADNIEMGGQRVAAILHYEINKDRLLSVKRDVIFPQLRTYIGADDPEWFNYRSYLRKTYTDEVLPVITVGENRFVPGPVDSVVINGVITFYHAARQGIRAVRKFYPSMSERLFAEKWTLTNVSTKPVAFRAGKVLLEEEENGVYGVYKRRVTSDVRESFSLGQGQSESFFISFSAATGKEELPSAKVKIAEEEREAFLEVMRKNFVVKSPEPVLDLLFFFSKIRAAESIYDTRMGLVHSPGGGRYYTGIWANDQAEYSGPFFPYLGYETGLTAAMNAYRMFLKNIPAEGKKIPASFEMQGEFPCCSKDRGDAAMIAFGASHFVLASGNSEYAAELWPLISWALDYCQRKINSEGVVASDSDELEGRFPTGKANLSTSSLYYGALIHSADLADAMGKPRSVSAGYRSRASSLAVAMEKYFGATVDGIETYRYYEGNTTLRSWICLPLVVGIETRKQGTLDALFSRLWTPNGVKIEAKPEAEGPEVFWDRGTLYAFRGAFIAGAADRALEKLMSFSKTRLLGAHVPYVVEAWPEGDMAHLSAESALYARVFSEGILGINPLGFRAFSLKPHLPSSWNEFSISHVKAFGADLEINVKRIGQTYSVTVVQDGKPFLVKKIKEGETITLRLK